MWDPNTGVVELITRYHGGGSTPYAYSAEWWAYLYKSRPYYGKSSPSETYYLLCKGIVRGCFIDVEFYR